MTKVINIYFVGWPNSNDDEVATNIDDYGAIDDPDIDDDESR